MSKNLNLINRMNAVNRSIHVLYIVHIIKTQILINRLYTISNIQEINVFRNDNMKCDKFENIFVQAKIKTNRKSFNRNERKHFMSLTSV